MYYEKKNRIQNEIELTKLKRAESLQKHILE